MARPLRDARCEGQANGYSPLANTWCWEGNLDFACAKNHKDHDDWEDQTTGAPLWSQKIKVFPWQVFAVVTIRFRPPVSVDHLWAATLLSNDVDGDDRTFQKQQKVQLLSAVCAECCTRPVVAR